VLLGIRSVLKATPDWVLSGINDGYNLGEDVFYSGTVGAAFEGCLQGSRAAAFSLDPAGDLDAAERWVTAFLERWEAMAMPGNRIWNVNLPKGEPSGFRLTGQDSRTYHDFVEERLDPRKQPYFWIGGDLGPTYAQGPGSDAAAALGGWVSLTPLRMDLACPEVLARRAAFEIAFNGPTP
jgi:5'-nucleotidase